MCSAVHICQYPQQHEVCTPSSFLQLLSRHPRLSNLAGSPAFTRYQCISSQLESPGGAYRGVSGASTTVVVVGGSNRTATSYGPSAGVHTPKSHRTIISNLTNNILPPIGKKEIAC